MNGILFYVMGASGAGKDSLLGYARRACDGRYPVVFAHRYITRPADFTSENHVALSTAEFAQRLQAGCFALHWDTHGYRYGIGIEIDHWMGLGLSVVVNGSRDYLAEAISRYPDLRPVLIVVSPERLRERLLARRRETEAAIEQRLRRAEDIRVDDVPGLVTLSNDGPLAEAGKQLTRILIAGCHR